jgi:hypothetical protein
MVPQSDAVINNIYKIGEVFSRAERAESAREMIKTGGSAIHEFRAF